MATAIEDLLKASVGEDSLNSLLGQWRLRVSRKLAELSDQLTQIINSGGGSAALRIFAQTGYITTEAGPPPDGPGQVGAVQGDDIIFNQPAYGILPYSTADGVFTLQPNKSYRLTANLQLAYSDPSAFATIYWVDALTEQPLRNGQGVVVNTAYNNPAGGYSGLDEADLLIQTSAAAQEVKLKIIGLTAGTLNILYGSTALVHEI